MDALQASALDPAGPLTVIVDLGGHKHLRDLEIAWEFQQNHSLWASHWMV